MRGLRHLLFATGFVTGFAAALASAPAAAQQTKTTEQQARSYILSAFMTGAAPMLLTEDAKIAPALRERLNVAPEADSRAVYLAMVQVTAGKSLTVRPSREEESVRADLLVEPGKPLFTLEVGSSTFVMQYDLNRDAVSHLGDASRPIAVTSPVSTPTQPEPIVEPVKRVVEAPIPAVQVVEPREPRVVEPREPRVAKPAVPASTVPMSAPAVQMTSSEPRLPPLKASGPCEIKPVMSDQDLVNCGSAR
jgi:hypothetical protein